MTWCTAPLNAADDVSGSGLLALFVRSCFGFRLRGDEQRSSDTSADCHRAAPLNALTAYKPATNCVITPREMPSDRPFKQRRTFGKKTPRRCLSSFKLAALKTAAEQEKLGG